MDSKQAKHTEGPWDLYEHSPLEVCNHEGRHVASTAPNSIEGNLVMLHEKAKANARLIAAAPDLLEACKAVADALDRCEQDDESSIVDELTQEIEDAVKAAIAKAEGGAE